MNMQFACSLHSPSDRVLEIGFGHGRTIERLAGVVTDGRVCGIDVSDEMLNLAVRRNRLAITEGRIELRKSRLRLDSI